MSTLTVRQRLLAGIALGCLLPGTLDMIIACWLYSNAEHGPQWVMQVVASGLLGKAAFEGGNTTFAIGVVAHYAIMGIVATLSTLILMKLPRIRENFVLAGLGIGVVSYFMMNYVVVPLSNFPFPVTHAWPRWAQAFAIHTILVGPPMAWAIRWGARSRAATP